MIKYVAYLTSMIADSPQGILILLRRHDEYDCRSRSGHLHGLSTGLEIHCHLVAAFLSGLEVASRSNHEKL